jgi:hypothetical protein
MKRSANELVAHGVVGGLLAGLLVAVWFLVLDIVAGHPFHTPATLAGVLYGRPVSHPTVQLVAMYSAVHFGVFAGLGIVAAWLMDALGTAPRLLLGIIYGLVAQEVLFYVGLFLGGFAPSQVIPWQSVIIANLLSGIALMAYLHRAERAELPFGLGALRAHPQLARGLVTGLWGAAATAVWFLLLDVASGRPFHTPAALGSVLLFGASNMSAVDVNLGVVAAYTVLHLVAFGFAGVIFVLIAERVERSPSLLLLAVMTAIVLDGIMLAGLALVAQWVLGALGVWSVVIANVIAVAAMGLYVWWTHPTLRHELRTTVVEQRV